jgi:AraC family ethanolamine operon transcriptional activator
MTIPMPMPEAQVPAAPEQKGMWSWRVATSELDMHARSQPGWQLHYEQLSPGRFVGLVHHVMLPGMRLVLERCNVAVRQTGVFPEGHHGFALALESEAPAIFNGQRVDRDAVMLGRHGSLDLCTPAPYGLIAVVVDGALLGPLWQHLYGKPPSAWMESQLVVPTRMALAQPLRELHTRAIDRASALLAAGRLNDNDEVVARQLRDALLIEWLEALPDSVDPSALPTALARKRLVDRACELMLMHTEEPLSMLDVCRRVGTSRRKLNYCFQEALGTSPVKYLRAVRLNGARRELRAATSSVHDAAARWGFWHLGQFSRDYKQQFGELPSATLKLAKNAPADPAAVVSPAQATSLP